MQILQDGAKMRPSNGNEATIECKSARFKDTRAQMEQAAGYFEHSGSKKFSIYKTWSTGKVSEDLPPCRIITL